MCSGFLSNSGSNGVIFSPVGVERPTEIMWRALATQGLTTEKRAKALMTARDFPQRQLFHFYGKVQAVL